MGTTFNNGDKPKNNITISKGNKETHKISPDGKVDRSFAQPNPSLPEKKVDAKAHASAQDEVEALSKNSTQGRTYSDDDDDDGSDKTE
jgi:hypothetical protein